MFSLFLYKQFWSGFDCKKLCHFWVAADLEAPKSIIPAGKTPSHAGSTLVLEAEYPHSKTEIR